MPGKSGLTIVVHSNTPCTRHPQKGSSDQCLARSVELVWVSTCVECVQQLQQFRWSAPPCLCVGPDWQVCRNALKLRGNFSLVRTFPHCGGALIWFFLRQLITASAYMHFLASLAADYRCFSWSISYRQFWCCTILV